MNVVTFYNRPNWLSILLENALIFDFMHKIVADIGRVSQYYFLKIN